MKKPTLLPFLALLLVTRLASAEEPLNEDLVVKKVSSEGSEQGWFPRFEVGANFSLGHSHEVVGQTDGVSIALGAMTGAGLLMLKDTHEWSLDLGWIFSLSRSADIAVFSKSQDDVHFQTRYIYGFPRVKWLGVFAKLRLESSFLPGWKVSMADAEVRTYDWQGNERVEDRYDVGPGGRIILTGPFSPVLLKENVGLMATPVDMKPVKLEINLGLGSHQLFTVDDSFILADDAATAWIELTAMRGYQQVGAGLEARIKGSPHAVFEYAAGVELLQPFYTSIDTDLKGMEYLNVRIDALLRLNILSFMSIDVRLDAKRYPVVVDRWQVSTSLLVTFHYAYPVPVAKPACPPCPDCPAPEPASCPPPVAPAGQEPSTEEPVGV